MPPLHTEVVFALDVFDDIGGASQLLCNLACALQRSGVAVAVYTAYPSSPDNRYAAMMRRAGIPVCEAVTDIAVSDVLLFLLAPLRAVMAPALALLAGRSWSEAWRRTDASLRPLLPGYRFRDCPPLSLYFDLYWRRLRRRRVVVHAHRSAYGLRWAARAGVPAVYLENGTPVAAAAHEWWWTGVAQALAQARLVLAGSQRAANACRQYFDYTGEVAVVPWILEAHPPSPKARKPDIGAITLGTAARLSAEKGIDVLLDAMTRVSPAAVAQCLIAGSGSQRDALVAQARAAGLEERVRFLGPLDDAGMEEFWSAVDVYALPSRSEGTPMVLLEAMHRNVPIVAADVGGVSELLFGGRCGELVPPEDPPALAAAIQRLAAESRHRAALAAAAHRRAEEHVAPASLSPWLAAYERALAMRSR